MSEENPTSEQLRGLINSTSLAIPVKNEFFARLNKLQTRERAGFNVQPDLQRLVADLRASMPKVERGSVSRYVAPVSRATPRAGQSTVSSESLFIADMAAIHALLVRQRGLLEEGAKPSRRVPLTERQFDLLVRTYDEPEQSGRTQGERTIEAVAQATSRLREYVATYLLDNVDAAVEQALYALDSAVQVYGATVAQQLAVHRRDIGAPKSRSAPSSQAVVEEHDPRFVAAERVQKRAPKAPTPFAGQAKPLPGRAQPGARRGKMDRAGRRALWHIAKMPPNDPKQPYYGCVMVDMFPYGSFESTRARAAKKHGKFPLLEPKDAPFDDHTLANLLAEDVARYGRLLSRDAMLRARDRLMSDAETARRRAASTRTNADEVEDDRTRARRERARRERAEQDALKAEEARRAAVEAAAAKQAHRERGAALHEARFIGDITRGIRVPGTGPMPPQVPPPMGEQPEYHGPEMTAAQFEQRAGSPLPGWFHNARVKDEEFEAAELEEFDTEEDGHLAGWLVRAMFLRYSLHYPMSLSEATSTIFARRNEFNALMAKYRDMGVTFDAHVSGHFIIDFRGLFSGGKPEDQSLYATNAAELIKSFFYVYGARSRSDMGIVPLRQALSVAKQQKGQREEAEKYAEAVDTAVADYYETLQYRFGGAPAILQLGSQGGHFALSGAPHDPAQGTAETAFQDVLNAIATEFELGPRRDALEKQVRARVMRERPVHAERARVESQRGYERRAASRMETLANQYILLIESLLSDDLSKAVVFVKAQNKYGRRVARLEKDVAAPELRRLCTEAYDWPTNAAFGAYEKYARTTSGAIPEVFFTDASKAVVAKLNEHPQLFPRENADEPPPAWPVSPEVAPEAAEPEAEVQAWPTEDFAAVPEMPMRAVVHSAEPFIIDWLNKSHTFVGVYIDPRVYVDPEDEDSAFSTFGPHNVVTIAQYYRQYKDSFKDPAKYDQDSFFPVLDEDDIRANEDEDDDWVEDAPRHAKATAPRLCVVRIVYEEEQTPETASQLDAALAAASNVDREFEPPMLSETYKIQFIWPFASEPLLLDDVADDEATFGTWMTAFAARQIDEGLPDNIVEYVQKALAGQYAHVVQNENVAKHRKLFSASLFDMYRAVRWMRWIRNVNIQAEIENAIMRNEKAAEAGRPETAQPVIVSEAEREAVLAFLAAEIKKASLRLARSGREFDFMHVTTSHPHGRAVATGGAYIIKEAHTQADGKTQLVPGLKPDLDELDDVQFAGLGLAQETLEAAHELEHPTVAVAPVKRQIAAKVRYKTMGTSEEPGVEREPEADPRMTARFGSVWRAVRDRWDELEPAVAAYWDEARHYFNVEQDNSKPAGVRFEALDDPDRYIPSAHWELDEATKDAIGSGAIKVHLGGEPRVVTTAKQYAGALVELKAEDRPHAVPAKEEYLRRVMGEMQSPHFPAVRQFSEELVELMAREVEPYLGRIFGPDEHDAVVALDEFWQQAQAAGPKALYYYAPLMVFFGKTAGTASTDKRGSRQGAITGNPNLRGDGPAESAEEEAIPPEVMEQIRENLGWTRRRSNRSAPRRPLTPAESARVNSLYQGPAFIIREAVVREMATGKYVLRVAFRRAVDKLVKRNLVDTSTGSVLLTPAGQTAEDALAAQMIRSKGRLREVLGFYDGYVRREQRSAGLKQSFVKSVRNAVRNKSAESTLRDNPPGYALSGDIQMRRMFDPRTGTEVETPVVEYRPQVFEAEPTFRAGKQQSQGRVPGTRGWKKGTTRYETKPYRPRIYLPIDPDHPTTQAFFEDYSLKTHERIRGVLDWNTKTHKTSAPDTATYAPEELVPMGRHWRGQGQRGKAARKMPVKTLKQMQADALKLAKQATKAQKEADAKAAKSQKASDKEQARREAAEQKVREREAKRAAAAEAPRGRAGRTAPPAPIVATPVAPPAPPAAPLVRVPVSPSKRPRRTSPELDQLEAEVAKVVQAWKTATADAERAQLERQQHALEALIEREKQRLRGSTGAAPSPAEMPFVGATPVEASPSAGAPVAVGVRRRRAPAVASSTLDLDQMQFTAPQDEFGHVKHPLDIDLGAAFSLLEQVHYAPDDSDLEKYVEFRREAYTALGTKYTALVDKERKIVIEMLKRAGGNADVYQKLVDAGYISPQTAARLEAGPEPATLNRNLVVLLGAKSVKRDNVSAHTKGSTRGTRLQRFRVQ